MNIRRILIAPLDWGLGHATRCVPIIRYFSSKGVEVVIASSGSALVLLKQEFPKLHFLELPAYNIHYKHDSMTLNMMMQLPKIRVAIKRENRIIHKIIEKQSYDLIISDNRYGVHHPKVKSIFMGHQLAIQMPKNMQIFSTLTLKWHRQMLKPFNQIWVPDCESEPNLSGNLSHNVLIEYEVVYLGPISRFSSTSIKEEKGTILVILSGQEPQRTELEKLVIAQITDEIKSVVLLRGLPQTEENLEEQKQNLKIYNHLPTAKLEHLIGSAELIICRSGYSSIMDMAAMNKRVLLIPTPGQTEQEYLANYLSEKNLAYAVNQSQLDLKVGIQRALNYNKLSLNNKALGQNIEKAINQLK